MDTLTALDAIPEVVARRIRSDCERTVTDLRRSLATALMRHQVERLEGRVPRLVLSRRLASLDAAARALHRAGWTEAYRTDPDRVRPTRLFYRPKPGRCGVEAVELYPDGDRLVVEPI